MESGLHHQQRTVRTTSNVFWINQLTSHLPNHDECNIFGGTPGRMAHNLHGRHTSAHGRRHRKTSNPSPPSIGQTRKTRPVLETREMPVRETIYGIPGRHPRERHHTDGVVGPTFITFFRAVPYKGLSIIPYRFLQRFFLHLYQIVIRMGWVVIKL